MKRMLIAIVAVVSSISAMSAQDHSPNHLPQSVTGSGPPDAQLVLDNASVSVIRIRMAPREKTSMHDLTSRVVVWLTDAHLTDTLATGETHDQHAKAGDVEWVSAQRHQGENLSDHPIEFIAIIPKQPESNAPHH